MSEQMEQPKDTYAGTQETFMSQVITAAKAHGALHNHDADAIMSDLAANLLSFAMASDESGELCMAILAKAQTQAEQIIERRAARSRLLASMPKETMGRA